MHTDPFQLIPDRFTDRPRVFTTAKDLERSRSLAEQGTWFQVALQGLLDNADNPIDVPDELPAPETDENQAFLTEAKRQSLAFHLTGNEAYLERALATFHKLAEAYLSWPITSGHNRGTSNDLAESRFSINMAQVYDLLAATGLDKAADDLFRAALNSTCDTSDRSPHSRCGNHNTWALVARLSVGLSLGERRLVHDALYGWNFEDIRRHGLVHQLRHDWLADGFHWERTPGYHFYTLMGFTEAALILQHSGINLWDKELPAQQEPSDRDLHRAYGPPGSKTLKAAFDVPFYTSFANGDFSLLHDSGLLNLRGAWIWGPIYEIAWQAYGDQKYAWLLNKIEDDYRGSPERTSPQLPMSLETSQGEFDFVRIRDVEIPDGIFNLNDNTQISQTGRHEQNCTLLPTFGVTMLRTPDSSGLAASVFWGPHSAGHQSPAALHLDIWSDNQMLTCAPTSGGYGDPNHLTWVRTTIAHNTVTVDETAMFPCDEESDSIWEADSWRERPSDGESLLFQPGEDLSACRACNDSVYPGVRLDRTIVLTSDFVLDVFRVISDETHLYDYAMHLHAELSNPEGTPIDMGDRRGYQHLREVILLQTGKSNTVCLDWKTAGHLQRSVHLLPPDSKLIAARPPELPEGMDAQRLGALGDDDPRELVIVRSQCDSALFVTSWPRPDKKIELQLESGTAREDLCFVMKPGDNAQRLFLPFDEPGVVVGS
ncbi:MAG: alginate lyase family protein [Planctomycetota bacterium]|nr:alginate lyase family protein [Planctomycetota bacterium]